MIAATGRLISLTPTPRHPDPTHNAHNVRCVARQWVLNGVLTLLCVETGPTLPWGYPTPVADPRLFLDYVNAIEIGGGAAFDLVLVSSQAPIAIIAPLSWLL